MFVAVVDKNKKPLMPTKPSRARRWVKNGDATPFWSKGVWCVRLNREPSALEYQSIAIGIDPGSKKEGIVVKSEAHAYINIQADAVTHVSDAEKVSTTMRRARRSRNCPRRAQRLNRAKGGIPPSTKARWQWKLRLISWLVKIYPITDIVVEDIKAITKGKRRWDKSFSPLEVGKNWFYEECRKINTLYIYQGFDTYNRRNILGLKKSSKKLDTIWEAHCVDGFVLAQMVVGGDVPDNKNMLLITPLRFHRRQLHVLQASKGGVRKNYGSTNSLGFKRGSLVKHPKWGVTYVGGTMKDKISLHSVETGKRITQAAKPSECVFLAYNSWRTTFLPIAKARDIQVVNV